MNATVSITIDGIGDNILAGTVWRQTDDLQTYIYPQDIEEFSNLLHACDLIADGPNDQYTETFFAQEYRDLATALGDKAGILPKAPNDQYAENSARIDILY
ncbi:hypothetical protein BISA_2352 [Bifidobacterium saguini DSM 23967]|uniref:Uncharacterized protein n=1 Tax=Bifidobacterium saguini DSM 23967 TaxID=1437607 RepID=A0A087D3S5_9BIFI|nr:hypothetical protein [Bifidobacterium saguini]KFI90175.1 hypothetical protein BISA_2352 [Bifidobacterium saguini DSM 23967]